MRISDWSSDVCSSDLRFTHSGAVAIAQDDDADDIVRRGFELPRFGPQGAMDRILGQRHRHVVGWMPAAGGPLRPVVAEAEANAGRLVLEFHGRARRLRQLPNEGPAGVLDALGGRK